MHGLPGQPFSYLCVPTNAGALRTLQAPAFHSLSLTLPDSDSRDLRWGIEIGGIKELPGVPFLERQHREGVLWTHPLVKQT